MPSKNKTRGNVLEKEVESMFKCFNIDAKRAWGSNGKAMGEHEEVDVLVPRQMYDQVTVVDDKLTQHKRRIEAIKIQCKRKKKLPDWLGFSEHVNAVCVREDRGEIFIILKLEDFIQRLK